MKKYLLALFFLPTALFGYESYLTDQQEETLDRYARHVTLIQREIVQLRLKIHEAKSDGEVGEYFHEMAYFVDKMAAATREIAWVYDGSYNYRHGLYSMYKGKYCNDGGCDFSDLFMDGEEAGD